MPRILVVGNLTLDIVNTLPDYPAEDSECRVLTQERSPGGNAGNTARVLAQLGHRVALATLLAADSEGEELARRMSAARVDLSPSRRQSGATPTSYIIRSQATGSRSIVHHRELPEYPAAAFAELDLADYDWLHFEGRNVAALKQMLGSAHARQPSLPISLELEKPRPGIEALLPYPELIITGRHYAGAMGHADAVTCLQALRELTTGDLVCAWGEAGAWYLPSGEQQTAHAPAHPPAAIVDTLGAGDTFNAGLIDARLRGLDWPAAVEAANRLAGCKCGQHGLDGLALPAAEQAN